MVGASSLHSSSPQFPAVPSLPSSLRPSDRPSGRAFLDPIRRRIQPSAGWLRQSGSLLVANSASLPPLSWVRGQPRHAPRVTSRGEERRRCQPDGWSKQPLSTGHIIAIKLLVEHCIAASRTGRCVSKGAEEASKNSQTPSEPSSNANYCEPRGVVHAPFSVAHTGLRAPAKFLVVTWGWVPAHRHRVSTRSLRFALDQRRG